MWATCKGKPGEVQGERGEAGEGEGHGGVDVGGVARLDGSLTEGAWVLGWCLPLGRVGKDVVKWGLPPVGERAGGCSRCVALVAEGLGVFG